MESTLKSSFALAPAFVPLQTTWSLYFDRYIGPGFTAEEYAAAIKEICVIDTVQTYWQWFNHLPSASSISASCSYHLMKGGIRPLWEDKANEEGGSFTFKIPIEDADHAWMRLTLSAIGGLLDDFLYDFDDELNGVSIGIRKSEASICIWNASASSFDLDRIISYLANLFKDSETCAWTDVAFQRSVAMKASYKVHKQLNNFGNDIKLPEVSKTPPNPKSALARSKQRPKSQSEPIFKKGARNPKRNLWGKNSKANPR